MCVPLEGQKVEGDDAAGRVLRSQWCKSTLRLHHCLSSLDKEEQRRVMVEVDALWLFVGEVRQAVFWRSRLTAVEFVGQKRQLFVAQDAKKCLLRSTTTDI
jgi:hypothetical protein